MTILCWSRVISLGLGVVLYQLLTRSFPYPVEGLSSSRILRHIESTPPTPMGKAWRRSPDAATDDTKHGETQPDRNTRVVNCPFRRDLELIVRTCLEKDAERRYPTVHALASDIRRYLAGEAVSVGPTSPVYKLRKWIGRRRLVASLAGSLLLLGFASVATILVLWRTAETEAQARADTIEVLEFTRELEPTSEANLEENLDNLHRINEFIHTKPANTALPRVHTRRQEEYDALISRLEAAITMGEIGRIAHQARLDPRFVTLIKKPEGLGTATDIVARIRDELQAAVEIPPSIGRGQDAIDIAWMLEAIEPDNPRFERARKACNAQLARMEAARSYDFDQVNVGEIPKTWNLEPGQTGVAVVERKPKDNWLRILSSPNNDRCISCPGPPLPIDGEGLVLAMDCTMRIDHLPEKPNALIRRVGGFHFGVGDVGVLSTLEFAPKPKHAYVPGTATDAVKDLPGLEPGVDHELRFRCYARNDGGEPHLTFDIQLDEDLLVEEARCPVSHAALTGLSTRKVFFEFFAREGAALWVCAASVGIGQS